MVAEWAKALTQIQVEAHQRSKVQIQCAFFIVFDHVNACTSMHSLVKIYNTYSTWTGHYIWEEQ